MARQRLLELLNRFGNAILKQQHRPIAVQHCRVFGFEAHGIRVAGQRLIEFPAVLQQGAKVVIGEKILPGISRDAGA